VPALWIVKHLDVIEDILLCFIPGAVFLSPDSLSFQELKEAFGYSVVMKIRKRRPTAVYPWVPHDAMIEFGAQIDCVHKFIYGHNNSTSYNQGETRAISPSQR
jgi:hypothetical protein